MNQAIATSLPADLLFLASCSTEPKPVIETALAVSYQAGVPGRIKVETRQLKATVKCIDAPSHTVELVAYLAKARTPADGGATAIALATPGAKPGGVVANTLQVMAKMAALDHHKHKATSEKKS